MSRFSETVAELRRALEAAREALDMARSPLRLDIRRMTDMQMGWANRFSSDKTALLVELDMTIAAIDKVLKEKADVSKAG